MGFYLINYSWSILKSRLQPKNNSNTAREDSLQLSWSSPFISILVYTPYARIRGGKVSTMKKILPESGGKGEHPPAQVIMQLMQNACSCWYFRTIYMNQSRFMSDHWTTYLSLNVTKRQVSMQDTVFPKYQDKKPLTAEAPRVPRKRYSISRGGPRVPMLKLSRLRCIVNSHMLQCKHISLYLGCPQFSLYMIQLHVWGGSWYQLQIGFNGSPNGSYLPVPGISF